MFSLSLYFAEKFLYRNSVDPGQMPRVVASELGLPYFDMSSKRVSKSDHGDIEAPFQENNY